MNSEADKFWDEISDKLRQFKGLRPLTPKQAETEFPRVPEEPLSADQIDSIIEAVTTGELASWEPLPQLDWTNALNVDEVTEDVLQLNRNRGENDPETDRLENELRQELLNDNGTEKDEDGMAGGAIPPRDGG
jgi:hypothetical protein